MSTNTKENDKYLVLRGKNKDIYFIQKRVSKKVASIIGKDFIKKSLETDNIDIARSKRDVILKELSFYENQEKKYESQQFVEIDGDDSIKPVQKDLKSKLHIVKNINLLMQKSVILKEKIFDNVWVQPAAGDAGGSLGAALALWHIDQNNSRTVNYKDSMQGSYLGPEYSQKEIEEQLDKAGAKYEILKDEELLSKEV